MISSQKKGTHSKKGSIQLNVSVTPEVPLPTPAPEVNQEVVNQMLEGESELKSEEVAKKIINQEEIDDIIK